MKNWCRIDLPGWQKHQTQFQEFVMSKVGNSDQLYNYILLEDFKKSCCDLVQLLETQIGLLERLVIFKMDQHKMQKLGPQFIHVDSGLQTGRLNWPILNPASVITRTFEPTEQSYQPKRHFINPPYKDYIDIYDPAHCREIDAVCFDKPTVFNILKPHSMFVNGDQWPRVMASFNFHDPTVLAKYLEE
jgi:hypothetical protein